VWRQTHNDATHKNSNAVLKVSTYIITNIMFRHIGLAAIPVKMSSQLELVFIYVSFHTDMIRQCSYQTQNVSHLVKCLRLVKYIDLYSVSLHFLVLKRTWNFVSFYLCITEHSINSYGVSWYFFKDYNAWGPEIKSHRWHCNFFSQMQNVVLLQCTNTQESLKIRKCVIRSRHSTRFLHSWNNFHQVRSMSNN
jgi:hypothetical protein